MGMVENSDVICRRCGELSKNKDDCEICNKIWADKDESYGTAYVYCEPCKGYHSRHGNNCKPERRAHPFHYCKERQFVYCELYKTDRKKYIKLRDILIKKLDKIRKAEEKKKQLEYNRMLSKLNTWIKEEDKQ